MFNPDKPYCTAGRGHRTLWQQDGVYYDPSTKQPVDLNNANGQPAPSTTTGKSALVCKFCGAKRATPELFREHLLAQHRDEVEPESLSPKPEEGIRAESAPIRAESAPAPDAPAKDKKGRKK